MDINIMEFYLINPEVEITTGLTTTLLEQQDIMEFGGI
jgi:hypothetical protein